MTFQHPGYAPWLLIALVPLVIHWLSRKITRPVALPTMRFLKLAQGSQSQLFRLRDKLLLVLRTAILVSIILAFMQPRGADLLTTREGRPTPTVIILDSSASMQTVSGGTSGFQRAKVQASNLLSQLPSGALCNVVVCGSPPVALSAQMESDHARLSRLLLVQKAGVGRANPSTALALAADLIQKAGGAGSIIVLSDLQRYEWDAVRPSAEARIQFVWMDMGTARPSNAGVTAIRVGSGEPREGRTFEVLADIWNSADRAQTVPVTLRLENLIVESKPVTIPPHALGQASFEVAGALPGWLSGTISIPDDTLALDNSRRFSLEVASAPKVLLITREDAAKPASGAYYLSRALDPLGKSIRNILPESLTETELAAADTVALTAVGELSETALTALSRWLYRGGSLTLFLDHATAPSSMQALNDLARGAGGLPFLPAKRVDHRSSAGGSLALGSIDSGHPAMRLFSQEQFQKLREIRFGESMSVTTLRPEAAQIASFSDGSPAIAVCSYGSGRALACNFTPSPRQNDLAAQRLFPPLVNELIRSTQVRNGISGEFIAGEALIAPAPRGLTHARLISPSDEALEAWVDPNTRSLTADGKARLGFYRLQISRSTNVKLASNLDPRESDLRKAAPHNSTGAARLGSESTLRIRGAEWWPWLVIAAMALVVVEYFVSEMTSRRPIVIDEHDHHHHDHDHHHH